MGPTHTVNCPAGSAPTGDGPGRVSRLAFRLVPAQGPIHEVGKRVESNSSWADRRQLPALPAAAAGGDRVPAGRHQDVADHADYCTAGGEDEAEWLAVAGQRSRGVYQLPYSEGQCAPAREGADVPAALPPDEPRAKSQADGTTSAKNHCIEHSRLRRKRTDPGGVRSRCSPARQGPGSTVHPGHLAVPADNARSLQAQ